jgi:predicted transcriptional regulator
MKLIKKICEFREFTETAAFANILDIFEAVALIGLLIFAIVGLIIIPGLRASH